MKTYKRLFEKIISPERLFEAWDEFKKGKRGKADVIDFERNLEQHIFQLSRDLRNKKYKHAPYTGFFISDPKRRHIHKASVRDRILHHAVFRALNPIFEPSFIPDSFSCRIGKGTHKGVERLRNLLRKASRNNTRRCFALKCDVRKFFDAIDHETLLEILVRRIKDADTTWLLKEIIGSFASGYRDLFHMRGVPIGNLTSQLFANVYMNEFDQFVEQELHIKYYVRYTDDFVILSNDRDELIRLIPVIRQCLHEKLCLELHPDKIQIIKYGRGVDFLGYIQFPHHRLLRGKSKQRMMRKFKHTEVLHRRGEVDDGRMNATLQSYLGVLSHANAFRLSETLKNRNWTNQSSKEGQKNSARHERERERERENKKCRENRDLHNPNIPLAPPPIPQIAFPPRD